MPRPPTCHVGSISARVTRRSVVVVAAAGLLLAGCSATPSQRTQDPTQDAGKASPSAAERAEAPAARTDRSRIGPRPKRSAPSSPPARICGSSRLDGPATAPSNATVIGTSQRADLVVDSARPGTTFYFLPGRHTLGNNEFDQIGPKRGDTFLGAPGAVLDGRGVNRYAFTGKAANVTIAHLTIENFTSPGSEGVVNHDSGHGWVIRDNTVRHNGGAGVFLGSHSVVRSNCLIENGQYGFSAYERGGVTGARLIHNEIVGNNTDDYERRQPGCGCSGGGKFWNTRRATVRNNYVHDNRGVGLWADTNNTGFLIQGNYLADNDSEALIYETSYNAHIVSNTFLRNGLVEGPDETGFPLPTIYLSEAGSDPRAGKRFGKRFRVSDNVLVDNWGGIIGWENSDRFAGSPNNTSTGFSTLVNPRVATVRSCGNHALIRTKPYFDDCRWKVQRLRVVHNEFVLDPGHVGSGCTAAAGCGYSGLISNYGTSPSWSPYQAYVVPRNIVGKQHNRWARNLYTGPWRFTARTLGNTVSWHRWRSDRYGQDEGSRRR